MVSVVAMAQNNATTYNLNSALNGTTITSPSQGLFLTDDNAIDGNQYAPGTNFSVTISAENPCPSPKRFCLTFTAFDIAPEDTLYFYDGPNTAAPLLLKSNNAFNSLASGRNKVFVSPTNETGTITVRFRVGTNVSGHTGFVLRTECALPCESVEPTIDKAFYRVRNGVVYDTGYMTIDSLEDGSYIDCINLCKGDDLVLNAHGTYTNYYGYYHGNDTTSTFVWDMGIDRSAPDGPDTIRRVGGYQMPTNFFSDTIGCYEIILSMVDEYGCASTMASAIRVRIAQSPIKTIVSELPLFCSNDSLRIIIGVEEMRAHLVLDTMHRAQIVSRTNDARTFIPDGPRCPGDICYSAPVTFTEFPNGKTVMAKEDICSICVNYEHTYMGDYSLTIICPSMQSAALKSHSNGGGSIHTGYPYGGSRSGGAFDYDGGSGRECDSAYNMYGIGLDYCFSRNGAYTLVDGNPADIPYNGNHFIYNGSYLDNVTVDFPPRPAAYRNSGTRDAGRRSFTTKRPSDHENKLNYYKPSSDFQTLVGCPLNGTWKIEICDHYGADNGWVFSWSLDICNTLDNRDCKYDVAIDSVAWNIDSSGGEIRNGHYYGPIVHKQSDSISYALMVDTAGYFPVDVYVYDAFGCRWDTFTYIHSIWAPKPELGNTRYICKDGTVDLTANDRHTNPFYTYEWMPNGEQSQTITSMPGGDAQSQVVYTVTATNNESPLVEGCSASDSVIVEVKFQPLPNFDASIYPMEGCEPLHETIANHSQYVDHHYWDFGDGFTSTEAEPSHTYSAGVYDIKYYVSNDNGCKDSLILPGIVTVYTNPTANFTWEPAYPTVRNPFVNITNLSEPQSDDMQYFWEYQYDKDNPYSFQSVSNEFEPTLTWNLGENTDGGYYSVRLVTLIENRAPSGKFYRCVDTTATKVLMVNDFLQFPNLITANGDGVNDRFVIKNLVGGLGYPNNRLDIYNRWGGRVFHAENIDSEDDFWDPAEGGYPTGTYFWYFYARGFLGVIERRGVVEVIR